MDNFFTQNFREGKTKKRFLLALMEDKEKITQDLRIVERAIQKHLPNFTLLFCDKEEEAQKLLNFKDIEAIILDRRFCSTPEMAVLFVKALKGLKLIPVFFITREPEPLIAQYRQVLYLYEEMDDYFISPLDPLEVTKKLRRIQSLSLRGAKRFHANLQGQLQNLEQASPLPCTISDISLTGFALNLHTAENLFIGQQMRLFLPLEPCGIFDPDVGERLKLACKIRRIALSGSKLGCSLEFATDRQMKCLRLVLNTLRRREFRHFQEGSSTQKKDSSGQITA